MLLYTMTVDMVATSNNANVTTFTLLLDLIQVGPGPKKLKKLECGLMPNVMVTLPNIGGAFCSTPQSLADAHY